MGEIINFHNIVRPTSNTWGALKVICQTLSGRKQLSQQKKVEWGQLILHNGGYYKFPVQKIEMADALHMISDKIDTLQLITTSTQPTMLEDYEIFATGLN